MQRALPHQFPAKRAERQAAAEPVARPAIAGAARSRWGWFPALSLLGALGVLLVAIAHSGARYDAGWAQPLYWTGLLVVVMPFAGRLAMEETERAEAIACLLFVGLALYLAKLLQSPLRFSFFDEFLHWRTANDIVATGRLFTENSLLPVSPLYPGLEVATTAVADLTGLSIFAAGALVVGAARLILMAVLYLIFERVGGSARLAAAATLIYTANPHFVIFDGQFAYESLALALLALVLLAILRRQRAEGAARHGYAAVALLGIGALVATHHATSYMLCGFLLLWVAAGRWYRLRRSPAPRAESGGVLPFALAALLANAVWLLTVSRITIGYLAPHLEGAVTSILGLIAGEGSDRELFKANNGLVTPLLERVAGLGAPALIMGALPFGLFFFWKRYRSNVAAGWLALMALSYPPTLAMRLTGGGWEISSRSSVFVFLPLAFVLALAIIHTPLPGPLRRGRPLLFALYAGVLFAGGIIAGWSPWARMPWPYRVGADTRSVEPQGLAAAAWSSAYLQDNSRMAADRINLTLQGTFGEQRMITHLIDGVSVSGIFLGPRIGPTEREIMRQGRIRYLLADLRISRQLPLDGHYYETWEKMVVPYTRPVTEQVLEKFDYLPGVSRIFDSGDIRIYDAQVLADGP
ncbi:MAG TPA: hypothetical protein VGE07_04605 [Herpetosiphonaceae bacterium]